MKPKLYEPFQFWQDQGVIWLYSDPHFNDPESKLMNSNWPEAEEIVKKINSKVGKLDTLIILGDIGDESYVRKLKGAYKILIKGNHDKGSSNYERLFDFVPMDEDEIEEYKADKKAYCKELHMFNSSFRRIVDPEDSNESLAEAGYAKIYDNNMFDYVFDGPLFINNKILLSHEPIDIPFGINIHGHVHGTKTKYTYTANKKVDINICSDVIDFEPVRLDRLIKEFKIEDVHRQCIDNAIERKK